MELREVHVIRRHPFTRRRCVTTLVAVGAGDDEVVGQCLLQRLSDRRILVSRRDGNNVFYRIADPCVTSLLDLGLCLIEETSR